MKLTYPGLALAFLLTSATAAVTGVDADASQRDRHVAVRKPARNSVTQREIDAYLGDTNAQVELARLLLTTTTPIAWFKHGDRRENAAKLLYRAAQGANSEAMTLVSAALRIGSFGFQRNDAAADCWAMPAKARSEVRRCIGLTTFTNPALRPTCETSYSDTPGATDSALTGSSGGELARTCLLNGRFALMVFGLPPTQRDLDRIEAFGKFGIEWMIMGDAISEDFALFMKDFNAVMEPAIVARYGENFEERVLGNAARQ